MTTMFPDGFLWGAATSAYQIEGSPLADGAAPSNWHRFSHTPGNTRNGDTGDVACDHYRRWPEDVALMQRLGLGAYRFSISWSRVLPEGVGRVNEAGLAFYDRLVDALLAAGIRPFATLYHWDLPAALDDRGAWQNPDSPAWFADYAAAVYRRLGDRVAAWATLNEPWVVVDAGYVHGVHAPGHRNWFEAPRTAHNLLRAHAAGSAALRAEGATAVGIVVNLEAKHAASDSPADRAARERAHAYMNRWYLDPVLLGTYPEELRDIFGEGWPAFPAAEVEALRTAPDFLGINYYSRTVVRDDPASRPTRAGRVRQDTSLHTAMDWEVYPEGLQELLEWVTARYGPVPLYVTENGAAFDDPLPADGTLDDPPRVAYLDGHLRAAARAIANGVDLRGYFAWSLLDNFEWAEGYAKRFGLHHVDYATQRRTPKRSAAFYAEVVRSNGAMLKQVGGETDNGWHAAAELGPRG